jgi:phosphoribosylaminoimidazole-succinocarboxamide synthase
MTDNQLIYKGKVRDLYKLDNDDTTLAMAQTDRCSSFNYHICNIEGKGLALTKTAEWWFNETRHIIDNHMVSVSDNIMYVRKLHPIKLEFVVRAYITGSLWSYYKKYPNVEVLSNGYLESITENGCGFCGVHFPAGLRENQKLSRPVITPTHKNENDDNTSEAEILSQNLLTHEQLSFITKKALELFELGTHHANNAGLILVDTKYEFGFDNGGNIILMDEIHTADSSRYWIASEYNNAFVNGKSPPKLDKDIVRSYIRENGLLEAVKNGEDVASQIPQSCKDELINAYNNLFEMLKTNNSNSNPNSSDIVVPNYQRYFKSKPKVGIIAGSESDKWHVAKIAQELSLLNIDSEAYYSSAHRNPKTVLSILEEMDKFNVVVWVTVAGMSNALSGVVAANTKFPVIACPPFKDKHDIAIDINSSLRCPTGVPVMTILDVKNVAISCQRMFNFLQ